MKYIHNKSNTKDKERNDSHWYLHEYILKALEFPHIEPLPKRGLIFQKNYVDTYKLSKIFFHSVKYLTSHTIGFEADRKALRLAAWTRMAQIIWSNDDLLDNNDLVIIIMP